MVDLKQIRKDIYNLINSYDVTEGVLDAKQLDFTNEEVYISYILGNASDGLYKQEFDLEIGLVTANDNIDNIQVKALEIDKILNKTLVTNARIKKKNAWYVTFEDTEEHKYYINLQYYVDVY